MPALHWWHLGRASPFPHRAMKTSFVCLLALLVPGFAASAATVQIPASRDNTLYQPSADSGGTTNSNGAGEHLFAGRTDTGFLRRGLLAFNVTNFIPPGSTVTGVTLTLYLSRSRDQTEPVTLHRVLASWGEGTSNATQEEGRGAQAAAGDATWYHRFYPTSLWATAGGVFVASASATTNVLRSEDFFSWSSTGLVADVQLWLNNPGTNFGWLVKGGEGVNKTAKRFDTRESSIAAQRPVLTVNFVSATPVGACCLPNGVCTNVTAAQCAALGGTYQGNNVPCTSNLCPVILAPFVDALPVPAPLQPITGGVGGIAYYEVSMLQVTQKLHRDLPPTIVWAYGNAFPGPVIEATVEQPVTVKWINNLRDASGNLRTNHFLPVDTCLHGPDHHGDKPLTVVHLHGGKVSQADDGYPEETFLPGQSRTNYYGNIQPPGTIWFHDHALGITRLNVYMGLAGLYLIRDAFENALGLPSGANEVPLVIQDRKFRADGSLSYPPMWDEHFFGDTLLVNGKVWPYLIVKRGKYRFRVVNGSTSRTYALGFSTGATFHQIGTDAGLLEAPVPLSQLTIMPGERADLVMDFSSYAAGTQLFLTNGGTTPFPGSPGVGVIPDVMKFIVTNIIGHTAALPATLRPVSRLYESNAVAHREFSLRKGTDPCTGSRWMINDLLWDDITEFPVLGTTEVWSFINRSGVSHPMHMHLVLQQILDRQPFIFTNNMVVPTGPRVPPAANEAGWKDTVRVDPGEIVRVIARFDGFPGKYPYHCHIIEHEDHEMMRQFEVVLPPQFTGIRKSGTNVLLDYTATPHYQHYLQRRDDLFSGGWFTFTNGIPGFGTNTTVTDPGGATQPRRFYRIGLTPP